MHLPPDYAAARRHRYRPSIEVVRKKVTAAWDRRVGDSLTSTPLPGGGSAVELVGTREASPTGHG